MKNAKPKRPQGVFGYKGRFVYREVALDPRDLKKIVRISNRLKKLCSDAQIVHTSDMLELDAINKDLGRLVKKYDQEFMAHSADF